MSDLIAIAFEDPASAFRLRAELVALERERVVGMADMVVVTRDAAGGVTLHQARDPGQDSSTSEDRWRWLARTLFLGPLPGEGAGAGAEPGLCAAAARALAEGLRPEGSAVLLLAERAAGDGVLARLGRLGVTGRILRAGLGAEGEPGAAPAPRSGA